ncbi:MAG: hypothetical protein GVY25_12725 [Bacteroidetes bacterium]|nr:hypothetical protein [Bacteroidota bacterium]
MNANAPLLSPDRNVEHLESLPSPEAIRRLRSRANDDAEAVAASLPGASDTYLVVSPRGTCICILLDNFLKSASWAPKHSPETVAAALQTG